MLTGSLSLEKWYQYLHGFSWGQWHTTWIQGWCTLIQWSFTKKCGSYGLKLSVSKVNLLISSILASACLRFHISYNLIRKGRAGQGSFFFLYSLSDNPVKMFYDTSCMMSLSMENFGKTCRAFFMLYMRMKVPKGVEYQSAMLINASIATYDMQGRSYSNIISYTRVTK